MYIGHKDSWVDYSHGIRLVARQGFLNGVACDLRKVLADPSLHRLISDEGPLVRPSYLPAVRREKLTTADDEITTVLEWSPGVRVWINEPVVSRQPASLTTELLFFALPNGNTLEQTLGKRMQPGDDWHFNIQHVAAQTRFLRSEQPDRNIVLILLEAKGLNWPSWRKSNSDELIVRLINVTCEIDTRLTIRQLC